MTLIVVSAAFLMYSLFLVIHNKRFLSVIPFAALGIYLPLLLYQMGWSDLIDTTESPVFNYIFISLAIILFIYSLIEKNSRKPDFHSLKTIRITPFGQSIVLALNVAYLLLYLIESYMGSGFFFPFLHKVDIHTYSAPIISYLTTAQFIFLAFDFLAFLATRKKRYLLLFAIIVIVPVVSRFSRMSIIMSLTQFATLALLVFSDRLFAKKYRKRTLILVVAAIGLFAALAVITNVRLSILGAQYTYATSIQYTGPDLFGAVSVYYGYFPLSFNNLKINILYRDVTHNYLGLYSFTSVFFGIFQFDTLFGVPVDGQLINRLVTMDSATVPTAFWDYYYDFGLLYFIPVLVALLLGMVIMCSANKEKVCLHARILACYFLPLWFFSSFQNTLFLSPSIVHMVLIILLFSRSFEVVPSKRRAAFYALLFKPNTRSKDSVVRS